MENIEKQQSAKRKMGIKTNGAAKWLSAGQKIHIIITYMIGHRRLGLISEE